jgi:hypothetical protein
MELCGMAQPNRWERICQSRASAQGPPFQASLKQLCLINVSQSDHGLEYAVTFELSVFATASEEDRPAQPVTSARRWTTHTRWAARPKVSDRPEGRSTPKPESRG